MIYRATESDISAIVGMAVLLWPESNENDMSQDFKKLVGDNECAIFIAALKDEPIGFAQVQLRHDYVEGTNSSPVGYLEGIFVRGDYRRRGYGKKLLGKCEEWAKEQGCGEFAGDCELSNDESLLFHLKMGFKESNRIVCFTKQL